MLTLHHGMTQEKKNSH